MLENTPYCALLYARAAEVKALGQLASGAKDRIFPIMLWRPWPNAKWLAKTSERFLEAFGERRFALDIDKSKFNYPSKNEAAAEFDLPGAIKSPNAASAVRINIHLHRQVHFGAPGEISDGEEPYVDD